MDEIIISVFYDMDNFCKELKKYFEHNFIPCEGKPYHKCEFKQAI